jgi:hypothetical protein
MILSEINSLRFTGRAILPGVYAQVWHAGEDQHRGLYQVLRVLKTEVHHLIINLPSL